MAVDGTEQEFAIYASSTKRQRRNDGKFSNPFFRNSKTKRFVLTNTSLGNNLRGTRLRGHELLDACSGIHRDLLIWFLYSTVARARKELVNFVERQAKELRGRWDCASSRLAMAFTERRFC